MRNLKITLGALLIAMSANFSMAQSNVDKATAQTEQMNVQLALSSDQKARIAELNFGIFDKNEAIIKDNSMSEELKKQSIEGNNEARLEILRGILTNEQYEVYKKSEHEKSSKVSSGNVKASEKEIKPATLSPSK